jgi:hypothetical protein
VYVELQISRSISFFPLSNRKLKLSILRKASRK